MKSRPLVAIPLRTFLSRSFDCVDAIDNFALAANVNWRNSSASAMSKNYKSTLAIMGKLNILVCWLGRSSGDDLLAIITRQRLAQTISNMETSTGVTGRVIHSQL